MPARPLEDEKRQEIIDYAPYFETRSALADYLNLEPTTLHSRILKFGIFDKVRELLGTRADELPPPAAESSSSVSESQNIKRESSSSAETLDAKGYRIKTLEQLLNEAEVDLDVWSVDRHQINKWEQNFAGEPQELFQVKAWLKRNEPAAELDTLRRAVVDEMRAHSPAPICFYRTKAREDLAQDILIPDLHLGKLAHAEETGENYDGKIAVKAYRHVFYDLLAHAQGMKVGRIIFPLGNDLLHVDSAENETTGGTRQDTDTRYYRSTRRAVNLMVEALDAMLQVALVDVVLMPGNHAQMQEQMLGEVIRAWYHNEPRLTLHDSPAPRKYIAHGKNLIGFTHGSGVKAADLPLLMAVEEPERWGRSEYRVWNTGHLHQRRSNSFGSLHEYKGVEVRINPSLAAADAWHSGKGFIGNLRAAESHIYSAEDGEIARFRAVLGKDFN